MCYFGLCAHVCDIYYMFSALRIVGCAAMNCSTPVVMYTLWGIQETQICQWLLSTACRGPQRNAILGNCWVFWGHWIFEILALMPRHLYQVWQNPDVLECECSTKTSKLRENGACHPGHPGLRRCTNMWPPESFGVLLAWGWDQDSGFPLICHPKYFT